MSSPSSTRISPPEPQSPPGVGPRRPPSVRCGLSIIRFLGSIVVASIVPVALVVGWEIAVDARLISALLFPAPSTVWDTTIELFESGILGEQVWVSVRRVLWGMAIGCGSALVIGALSGYLLPFERAVDPTVQMVRMIPHLALTSLFVLWFGIGETSKILLIAKGVFFPIYIATFLGFRNVDVKLLEVGRVLEFTRWQTVRRILIPGAVPHLFLGLRISMGIAWGALVVSEMVSASSGLGYMMVDARAFSDTPVVFAGILCFAVLGIGSDLLIRLLERRVMHWHSGVLS